MTKQEEQRKQMLKDISKGKLVAGRNIEAKHIEDCFNCKCPSCIEKEGDYVDEWNIRNFKDVHPSHRTRVYMKEDLENAKKDSLKIGKISIIKIIERIVNDHLFRCCSEFGDNHENCDKSELLQEISKIVDEE